MTGAVTPNFGARLLDAMRGIAPLCVGIDPHASLLAAWGLPANPSGLREFSLTVLEGCAARVAAVKPQSAFYEEYGSAGIAVLEETLGRARELGVLTILDVKRGDIGSTMAGYAAAYLRPGAPLEADSITLSPYLGPASLAPAIELALAGGKGCFLLALTSNPEGAVVQHARTADGRSVAAAVAEHAAAINAPFDDAGPVGLVVGATVGGAVGALGLDLAASGGIVLAPGVGAQGGTVAGLREVFGAATPRVLASVSRGVLAAGPEGLRAAVVAEAERLRQLA